MKKTIRIANLIALVNEHNRLSTCTPDVRHGWNAILEVVLHQADAYKGYGYLTQDEVPAGHAPGIAESPQKPYRIFPDESRRCYAQVTGL